MDKNHIKQLALQDADRLTEESLTEESLTEESLTEESLTAAADMYDKLVRNHTQATMVQDDIMGTPLPNGLLQWFGYEFERVDLPDIPLLKHGDYPIWLGTPRGFAIKTGVADALVEIRAEQFETDEEDEGSAAPTHYELTIKAHGLERAEEITCKHWHEVQQKCRAVEQSLDDSHAERHALCQDEDGNLSENACAFCERGQKGG